MPSLVQCPTCQKQLRVPDHLLGKKVRCPACREIFVGESEDLPVAPLLDDEPEPMPRRSAPREPEEDLEEEPVVPRRKPARRRQEDEEEAPDDSEQEEDYAEEEEAAYRPVRSADWGKVRTGIGLVLLSVCILIGMIVAVVIGGIVAGIAAAAAARAGPGAGAAAGARGTIVLTVIVGILGLAADGTALAGYVLCLNAPAKNSARTLAIATLVLAGAGLLLTGVDFVVGLVGGGHAAAPAAASAGPLRLIAGLVSMVKFFVFLFFLRAAARCLKARAQVDNIRNLMILYGAALAGFLIMVVLALVAVAGVFAAGPPQPGAPPAPNAAAAGIGAMFLTGCACIDVVLLLAGAIWYIVILVQMRAVIGNRLSR
jgi:predicted Zn finger-like uncharacterized protein